MRVSHWARKTDKHTVQGEANPLHLAPVALRDLGLGMLFTLLLHAVWRRSPHGSLRRGVADSGCHIGIALMLAYPAVRIAPDPIRFLAITVGGSIVLDLDHVPAAGTLRFEDWSTMENRPVTHSILAPIAIASTVEYVRPGRLFGLAAFSAVASHLVRDLTTGGIPLVHPRRIIELPLSAAIILFIALAAFNRRAYTNGIRSRTTIQS